MIMLESHGFQCSETIVKTVTLNTPSQHRF